MKNLNVIVEDKICTLELDRGITNALNAEMIDSLMTVLAEIQNDSEIKGIVLTSKHEKFFSIGFDIPEIYSMTKDEFHHFYSGFNKLCIALYTVPKLTIAALKGHAVAGGCILALCCDYRYLSVGRNYMGLNEIKLGVPLPYPTDCILRDLVGSRVARQVADFGEFYLPESLLQLGMIDKIVTADQVYSTAIQDAKIIGSYSSTAFQVIKHNRTELIKAQIVQLLSEREKIFVDCWYRAETRQKLKEAIEKF